MKRRRFADQVGCASAADALTEQRFSQEPNVEKQLLYQSIIFAINPKPLIIQLCNYFQLIQSFTSLHNNLMNSWLLLTGSRDLK